MKVISGPRYFKMFFSETNPYCPFESVHPHQRCVGVTEQVYFLVALRVKSEELTYIWLWECLISDDWRGERCLLWLLRMCHSQYNDLMIRCLTAATVWSPIVCAASPGPVMSSSNITDIWDSGLYRGNTVINNSSASRKSTVGKRKNYFQSQ